MCSSALGSDFKSCLLPKAITRRMLRRQQLKGDAANGGTRLRKGTTQKFFLRDIAARMIASQTVSVHDALSGSVTLAFSKTQ